MLTGRWLLELWDSLLWTKVGGLPGGTGHGAPLCGLGHTWWSILPAAVLPGRWDWFWFFLCRIVGKGLDPDPWDIRGAPHSLPVVSLL